MIGEVTADPTCRITHRGDLYGVPAVVYANLDGERWVIVGACTACGACDGDHEGSGPPDGRLDVPVRPEGPPTWPGCALSGRYC